MAVRKKSVRSHSISDLIQPISESEDKTVALFYGRSGTGKTKVGSTFPTPILFVDIREKGLETIRNMKDIDVFRVNSWTDFHSTEGDSENLYWYLKDKDTPYATIVIDQCSNLQDLGMAEVRDRANKDSAELFSKKNWGELSGLLKNAIQDYRGLSDKYHIVFLAHERVFDGGEEEDEALEPSVGARMMPSVGDFLNGAVDTIGNTFIREVFKGKGPKKERRVDYCMRLGPHAFYNTKIRRPAEAGPIPPFIVNPTYSKLKALMEGKPLSKTKKKARKKKAKLKRRK